MSWSPTQLQAEGDAVALWWRRGLLCPTHVSLKPDIQSRVFLVTPPDNNLQYTVDRYIRSISNDLELEVESHAIQALRELTWIFIYAQLRRTNPRRFELTFAEMPPLQIARLSSLAHTIGEEQTKGGGLDHFRPKTEIKRKLLNPGIHNPDIDRVAGRRFSKRLQPGYYDRAYDWDNFVLSCDICNSKWKGTYFPVTRASEAGVQEEYLGPPVDDEIPTMRSPFADSDPLTEFNINADGLVTGRTSGALSNIAVCGLWRESLTRNRKDKYAAAWRALSDYLRAGAPEQERDEARQELVGLGGWNKPLACVVRAAAAAKGLDWNMHFGSS